MTRAAAVAVTPLDLGAADGRRLRLAGDARVLAGVALLLSRLLVGPGPAATPVLAVTYASILALCAWPGAGSARRPPSTGGSIAAAGPALGWPAAVALGVAAVGLAAGLAGPRPPLASAGGPGLLATAGPALLASAAAVAEEGLFRGLVYRRLEPGGAILAMAGSAVLFAAVHVPAYGLGALPLDLAAGLLFAWQRRATGGWAAPAITHVAANLLAVAR